MSEKEETTPLTKYTLEELKRSENMLKELVLAAKNTAWQLKRMGLSEHHALALMLGIKNSDVMEEITVYIVVMMVYLEK